MSTHRCPHRIQSVHVESIDGELCVYDTVRQQVHALNHTAAFIWQRCDGLTAPSELAAALSAQASIDDAEAVVLLTLQELAAAQLLAAPLDEVAPVSRRDLLRRGVAAAAIPAIYSIVAPSPAEAQSPPDVVAPTLTAVSPNQGIPGATVAVTLTGTNFIVGGTTVTVAGGGVTVNNVVVGSSTSLTASFVLDPAAATGSRTVTVTTAGGTSGGQTFTINLPPPAAPTLTSLSPTEGLRGSTVAVTLTGTNFIVGGTTVTVDGGGVTVSNVVVGSSTSLTASFVLDLAAAGGSRAVTVTTAGGTSGAQTFTITLPPSGSQTFNYTGGPEAFTVPAGVVSITILATGASGSPGFGTIGGTGGLGGRTTATVPVTPGTLLTVRVGGQGIGPVGGFNGGGNSTGLGGGAGGASSVRDGATPLVVVGGGGGTQNAGGAGGTKSSLSGTDGTAGVADMGGIGGAHQPNVIGGGGGGGGYFGGGGGGGGNPSTAGGGGGGGGSSFTAPGATGVVHTPGVKASNGFVTISW